MELRTQKWWFLPFTAAWPKLELNASKIKEECGQIEIYGKSRKLCGYDMVLSILGRRT
jgi:hypothetical protein